MFWQPKSVENGNRNRDLELHIDSLEDRFLLAADVSVSGDTIKVTGTDDADVVNVYMNGGTISVYNGDENINTGLETAKKLIISVGDGDDEVQIQYVNVTGKTIIKLGNDENSLRFEGLHNSVKIIGGNDADHVLLEGGVGLAKNGIKLKGGEDKIEIDLGGYIDAFNGGQFDDLDPFEVLAKPPTIKANLGADNDLLFISYYGSPVTDAASFRFPC